MVSYERWRIPRFAVNAGDPMASSTTHPSIGPSNGFRCRVGRWNRSTKRDQEADGPHGDFQVLPGGETVVFTVWGDPIRIEAMRLASWERKVLTPGVKPYVAPTGHLIFASLDGRILAAPLDVDTMELTGAPVPIVEGVVVSGNAYPYYSVSQTGTLVYWSGDVSSGGREFVWVGRNGVATPVDPGWTFERGNVHSG